MELINIENEKQIFELLLHDPQKLKVMYFYLKDSAECNQMSDVIAELKNTGEYDNTVFLKVDASELEDVCKKNNISSVPTFLFYSGECLIDMLVGANVPMLSKKLKENLSKIEDNPAGDINSRLKKLINKAPVMLFMKGSPDIPRCGFSKQVIALLNSHNAQFETFDILQDFDVREGLKKYSNWPTYPQLYVKGELIGGLDILKELSESGELDEVLKS
ncbi:glutaredoxin 3-like [Uloborus diversus]|uniref:glutaredoxin 3-like n=1 Tax=Uloborus diversus TaxID=327109 RepID=UPI0024096AFB|nr:glutaredoxin 3-like [Uloborus diversus]